MDILLTFLLGPLVLIDIASNLGHISATPQELLGIFFVAGAGTLSELTILGGIAGLLSS